MKNRFRALVSPFPVILLVIAGLSISFLAVTSCSPEVVAAANRINRYLAALRNCETGGNYQMHTFVGGREYGGAYGFDTVYWRLAGPAQGGPHRVDPQFASRGEQDWAITKIIHTMGASRSNPGCTAKIGGPSAW